MKNEIKNFHPELEIQFTYQHSTHSKKRAFQRGISENHIQTALHYCESFFKQGLVFHVVKRNLIPRDLPSYISDRIQNMVIVMASDEGRIITCYKSSKALKQIKHKDVELMKYRMVS